MKAIKDNGHAPAELEAKVEKSTRADLPSPDPDRPRCRLQEARAHQRCILRLRGEGEAPFSTSTPKFSLLTFEAREVDVFPEVTNDSLEDLGSDVEAFLTDKVALAFAQAEADVFLTGDGLARPRGLLTYDAMANAKYAWRKIGYVASGASGAFATFNPSDTLIDLVHALKAPYRAASVFLMNDLTLAAGPADRCRRLAPGLSHAHRRSHARRRRRQPLDRLRRFPARLPRLPPPRPAPHLQ